MREKQSSLPLSGVLETEEKSDRICIPAYVEHWDEYFLNVARAISIKSKDPRCRVGAVIVSEDNVILSTGFNGLPRGVHDDDRILLDADEKLKIICHAEGNPCLSCCNAIIQAGLKRIYTHDKWFWNDDPMDNDHSRKIRVLKEARIVVDARFHPTFSPSEPITVPKPPMQKPQPKKGEHKKAGQSGRVKVS